MDILTVVSLANQLVAGLSSLGLNMSQVAALQAKAAEEGRELQLEDFEILREQARRHLDSLDGAIEEMSQNGTQGDDGAL